MSPDAIETIAAAFGLSVGCICIMVGIKMWIGYRLKRLGAGLGRADLQQVNDQVEALREQLDGVQAQLEELNERVDFAERLLPRGPGEEA